MSEHTKTPWLINPKVEHNMQDGEASRFTRRIVTEAVPRQHVITLDFGYGSKCDDANTDFIVKAVNSHDAMLDALKFAKAQIKKGSPKKALPVLRETIAQAEAKQ